jgi:pimeloyl-ACP methyl ester carboxylesterase
MKISSFNVSNINRRFITGGVGHNLPQEAPHAFAQAIVDVAEV